MSDSHVDSSEDYFWCQGLILTLKGERTGGDKGDGSWPVIQAPTESERNQIAVKLCISRLKREGMYDVVNAVPLNELSREMFVYKVLDEMMSRQMYGLAEQVVAFVGTGEAEEEVTPPGDVCFRSSSCMTLTFTMAEGHSWWNYVVEGDKVYIESSEGRERQWEMKLIAKKTGGESYLRLESEYYKLTDNECEVQEEEDVWS